MRTGSGSGYGALSIVLYIISTIEFIGGALLVVASGWILSFAPAALPFASSGYAVALLKAIGIIAIALSYLVCAAARDPVRYVAVIDALIFVLIAAAVLNVYALGQLHLGAYYPPAYLIVRAAIQLLIAAALIAMRPRGVPSSGNAGA